MADSMTGTVAGKSRHCRYCKKQGVFAPAEHRPTIEGRRVPLCGACFAGVESGAMGPQYREACERHVWQAMGEAFGQALWDYAERRAERMARDRSDVDKDAYIDVILDTYVRWCVDAMVRAGSMDAYDADRLQGPDGRAQTRMDVLRAAACVAPRAAIMPGLPEGLIVRDRINTVQTFAPSQQGLRADVLAMLPANGAARLVHYDRTHAARNYARPNGRAQATLRRIAALYLSERDGLDGAETPAAPRKPAPALGQSREGQCLKWWGDSPLVRHTPTNDARALLGARERAARAASEI